MCAFMALFTGRQNVHNTYLFAMTQTTVPHTQCERGLNMQLAYPLQSQQHMYSEATISINKHY